MIKSNLIREAGKYVLSSVLAIGLSYSIADAGKYPKGTQHYLDNVKIIGIDGFEKIFKNEVFVDGRFINYGNNTIAGMISGIKGNEQTRLEDILNKFEGKIQSIKYNGITYNQENFDNFYSILKKKKRIEYELIEVYLTSKEPIGIKKIEIIKPEKEEEFKENKDEIKIPKLEKTVNSYLWIENKNGKESDLSLFPSIEKNKQGGVIPFEARIKKELEGKNVSKYTLNGKEYSYEKFIKKYNENTNKKDLVIKILVSNSLTIESEKEINTIKSKNFTKQIFTDEKGNRTINFISKDGTIYSIPEERSIQLDRDVFCKVLKEGSKYKKAYLNPRNDDFLTSIGCTNTHEKSMQKLKENIFNYQPVMKE